MCRHCAVSFFQNHGQLHVRYYVTLPQNREHLMVFTPKNTYYYIKIICEQSL